MKEALLNSQNMDQVCATLKQELEREVSLGWNVVVGKDYGSHVLHRTKHYLHVEVDGLSILIWKS